MNTNFTADEARRLYGSLGEDLHAVQVESQRLAERRAGLEEMRAAIVKVYPELKATPTASDGVGIAAEKRPTRPKGMTSVDAVTTVVNEDSAGNCLTVLKVIDGLARRQWLPDADEAEAAVRTALSRATTQNRIERVKLDGRTSGYRPPPNAETDADTSVSEAPIHAHMKGGGSYEAATETTPQDQVQHDAELLLGASGI